MKRKLPFRLALVLALVATFGPARASCWPEIRFSQVQTGNYHYILLPQGSTGAADTLVGRFWKAGAPSVNEGSCDETTWLFPCGADCALQSDGPVFYVDGALGEMQCTSSCINGEMDLLIEDRVSTGLFLAARIDESHGQIFDFSRLGDLRPVAIPRPSIQSFSYPNRVATLRIDDPAAGFYGLPGVPATGTITAFRVLSHVGNPPPNRTAWTEVARIAYAGGQTIAQVTVGDPCPSNQPGSLSLAVALELDGQVLTTYVSDAARFGCIPERWYGGGHMSEIGSDALQLSRSATGEITLTWGRPCVSTNWVALYEGVLGDWSSHVPLSCGVSNPTTIQEPAGNAYFLVVPQMYNFNPPDVEGSYGTLRDGSERPASSQACIPQQAIVDCP